MPLDFGDLQGLGKLEQRGAGRQGQARVTGPAWSWAGSLGPLLGILLARLILLLLLQVLAEHGGL